jgi:cyclic pyranopterin monophosphate synthase
MRAITKKIETLRRATAESRVLTGTGTVARLLCNDVPKKDILPLARAAGVMAAKRTWELIPYCHPISLDWVEIDFKTSEQEVLIRATVEAVGKTGVEMEALAAASVAALTVYDMLKPVDAGLEIGRTLLVSKTGGKSDFQEKLPPNFRAAVLTSSDRASRGVYEDKSGRTILERLRASGIEAAYDVVPDDVEMIRALLLKHCENGVQLVLTTGGTGLGARDVTVEATEKVIEREIPGIMEAARAYGQRRTPYAMLSRGLAGQRGNTLIVNLPGSSKGVEESLDAVFPAVLHAFKMMRGLNHEVNSKERA